ncbi:MAG: chemotaxis protein CheW [Candidatus Hodarchaeales archaeon]|jgi:chemotaxis signal transduction protein
MVSIDVKELRKWDNAYLIVKLGLNEFSVSIEQIDGIKEFNYESHKNKSTEFILGSYFNQNEVIPIINLKKYLCCPNPVFVSTLQSRILFLNISEVMDLEFDEINVGVVFDAIIGVYHDITSSGKVSTELSLSSELKCFQLDSYIEINSKKCPILDLKKVFNFASLKRLLEQYSKEKI